ncbi:MAG TPA: tetratricopeptide repeat protein [Bacteroidia bacterium]|jgi:tetratricopeptide (TPR) repeat protein|nr:tetratricopeptide repeat protein [Bacteroidia bacterium]
MLKHYILTAALVIGTFYCANAQTTAATKTVTPVYSGLSADGDMKRDKMDYVGAVDSYTAQINTIGIEAQRICKLKTDYLKMSEFDRMNANTDEVNKQYTDWAKLYYGRAMANIALGKKPDAKADLDMAVGLDNTMADAYYQRALLMNTKDTKDEACEDMSKAAALGSDKAKIAFDDNFCWNSAMQHFKNGSSNVTLKKYDEAIVDLDIAIALCPDSGLYFAKRGQAYLGKGDKTKALADLNMATQVSPKSPEGYYQLGVYYFNLDDFDKAFDNFTLAINNGSKNYDAYMYRAQCCERSNKMTSAIYDYGQAISLRPSDPEAYYRRALIERDMKNVTDACKDFRKASALGSEDATPFIDECK